MVVLIDPDATVYLLVNVGVEPNFTSSDATVYEVENVGVAPNFTSPDATVYEFENVKDYTPESRWGTVPI